MLKRIQTLFHAAALRGNPVKSANKSSDQELSDQELGAIAGAGSKSGALWTDPFY